MKGKTMGSYILPLEEIKYRVIQDGASFIGVDHLGGRRKALRVIFECSCGSIYEKLWGNIKKGGICRCGDCSKVDKVNNILDHCEIRSSEGSMREFFKQRDAEYISRTGP